MAPIQTCPNCRAHSISRRRLLFSRAFADQCDRCGARVSVRPSRMRWMAMVAFGALVLWLTVSEWHFSHWAGMLVAVLASLAAMASWLTMTDVPLDVRR